MSTELVSSLRLGEVIVDIQDSQERLCIVVGHAPIPHNPKSTTLEVLMESGFHTVWEYEIERTLKSFYIRRL